MYKIKTAGTSPDVSIEQVEIIINWLRDGFDVDAGLKGADILLWADAPTHKVQKRFFMALFADPEAYRMFHEFFANGGDRHNSAAIWLNEFEYENNLDYSIPDWPEDEYVRKSDFDQLRADFNRLLALVQHGHVAAAD